ncbi:MAG: hypothetical protein AVDCRST_MAG33-2055, partial [uncultured Thermomicrobiales bacterium]
MSFFSDVPGMVVPLYDPVAVVDRLQGEGIYAIARL